MNHGEYREGYVRYPQPIEKQTPAYLEGWNAAKADAANRSYQDHAERMQLRDNPRTSWDNR